MAESSNGKDLTENVDSHGDATRNSSTHKPLANEIEDVEVVDGRIEQAARKSKRLQTFRYYFQHPYFRIFVAYFVTFCNFLIYAEDPVAHSYSKCEIPVIGNAFSFVFTKYTGNAWVVLKVFLWITALVAGLVLGKLVFHEWLFKRRLRLSMFSNDQGSWMIMFLCTLACLFIFSWIYNGFLSLDSSEADHKISGYLGTKNHVFMRVAALGTWFGDFITAWMVTDMMLQDTEKYKHWAPNFRAWWKRGWKRVILFWLVAITCTAVVISAIATDYVKWDKLNRGVFYTNEVGRAFLASFILVMDFMIVMQDWEFPIFQTNQEIKLPGLNTAHIQFRIPDCLRREYWYVHITGKWFQYGILFIVMLLDLNMWKNQIMYKPLDFAQYVDGDDKILSVMDQFSLDHFKNATIYSYDWRNTTINPLTNNTYLSEDFLVHTRYRGYGMAAKGMAFIPSIFVFILFGALIWIFGREGSYNFESDDFRDRGVSLTSVKVKRLNDSTDGINEGNSVPDYGSTDNGNEAQENSMPKVASVS